MTDFKNYIVNLQNHIRQFYLEIRFNSRNIELYSVSLIPIGKNDCDLLIRSFV